MPFSFIIITDGFQAPRVRQIIASIEQQNIPQYEILIISERALQKADYSPNQKVRLIAFENEVRNWEQVKKSGGTFPLSKKKNLALQHAQYENLCFLHDYVLFDHNWYQGFLKFETNWKVSINKIFSPNGQRFTDWMLRDHPTLGVGPLPYQNEAAQWQYVSGTYFCVKKSVFQEFPLNETLGWGESEDVEWSKRIRQKYKFSFNPYSTVHLLKKKRNFYEECLWQGREILIARTIQAGDFEDFSNWGKRKIIFRKWLIPRWWIVWGWQMVGMGVGIIKSRLNKNK